jgi:4-amino-4-deoxy-L-arabinose transferase-like glycosyltransferase
VSKKRKTRRRPADEQVSRPAAVGFAAAQTRVPPLAPSPLVRFGLPLFLVFLALYLVLFFTSPEAALRGPAGDTPPLRLDMLRWLWNVRLAELPRLWTEGSWANVGIFDRAIVFLAAVLQLAVSLVFGRLLLSLSQAVIGLTKVETLVLSLGVGMHALSLLVLGIGLAGFLQSYSAYIVPLLVILAAAWRYLRRSSRSPHDLPESSKGDAHPPGDWLRASALWLALPFVLLMVAGALFPPRAFDVREYHLQAPKEWFTAGRITFLPHNVYANMPLGPQILSLPAMALLPGERSWWWGAMVGKLLLASYTPLTALALFAAGRRFFSATTGVVAALVYISIPWIALVSIEGYVDGALACYLLLAIFAALLAQQTDDAALRSRRWLLSGFFAGAAIGAKYPGALFVVVPLTVWLIASIVQAWRWRATQAETMSTPNNLAWQPLALFILAVAIGGGPWLTKNWVLTGNPTYPLLYSVFGGATRTPDLDAQWRAAHAVPRDEYGQRFSPRQIAAAVANLALRSEWLSPLLWPLAVLALFSKAQRRTTLAIAAMLAFVLVMWFAFTHRIERFWLPALPLAALLAGIGAGWRFDAAWRRVVIAMLFWGLLWNLSVIAGALAPPQLLVAYEKLRSDPSLAPLAHVHLNEVVLAGNSVLLVGDAEPFDLEMPAYYNTCFDPCVIEELLRGKSPRERLDELHRRRISHVLVNWSELARYRSPGNYGYSSDWPQPEVFRELVRQGVLKNPQRVRSRLTGQVGEIYPVAGL